MEISNLELCVRTILKGQEKKRLLLATLHVKLEPSIPRSCPENALGVGEGEETK